MKDRDGNTQVNLKHLGGAMIWLAVILGFMGNSSPVSGGVVGLLFGVGFLFMILNGVWGGD